MLCEGLSSLTELPLEHSCAVDALCTLHQDKHARACPRCLHVNRVSEQVGQAHNDLTCQGCAVTFCRVHGGAHPGLSCLEYVQRLPIDAKQREFARRSHVRRCPSCMAAIVKNGGCDHMRCACGFAFNWSSARLEVPCRCINVGTSSAATPSSARTTTHKDPMLAEMTMMQAVTVKRLPYPVRGRQSSRNVKNVACETQRSAAGGQNVWQDYVTNALA